MWLSSSLGFLRCPPWLVRGECPGLRIKKKKSVFLTCGFIPSKAYQITFRQFVLISSEFSFCVQHLLLSLHPCSFCFPPVVHSQCNPEVSNLSITVSCKLLNFPSPLPRGTTAPKSLNWAICSLKKELFSYFSRFFSFFFLMNRSLLYS